MAKLELTTDRGHHEVEVLNYAGETIKLKIPKELKVAEVERILDLQEKAIEIAKLRVYTQDEEDKQLSLFWDKVFIQLEIMFKIYQPEMTLEELKSIFSQQEALSITGFFNNNRFLKISEESKPQKKSLLN